MSGIVSDGLGNRRLRGPKGPWDEGVLAARKGDRDMLPAFRLSDVMYQRVTLLAARRGWDVSSLIRQILSFYRIVLELLSDDWEYVGPSPAELGAPSFPNFASLVRPSPGPWDAKGRSPKHGYCSLTDQLVQFCGHVKQVYGRNQLQTFDQAAWLFFLLHDARERAGAQIFRFALQGAEMSYAEGDDLLQVTDRDFRTEEQKKNDPARAWLTLVASFCAAGDGEPFIHFPDGRQESLKGSFHKALAAFMEANPEYQFQALTLPVGPVDESAEEAPGVNSRPPKL